MEQNVSESAIVADDTYKTIEAPAEAVFKDKSSRFLAFAWPVTREDEIKPLLEQLRKKYYDATHHCYAWRLGTEGEIYRSNDDGEPSGTAGRPILGQMLSNELTNMLIVVVRYFGGTKLGVAGLINAYREAAREVIANAVIVERTVDTVFKIRFTYAVMNDVMRIVKDMAPRIVSQKFDNVCEMELAIRRGYEAQMRERLEKCESVELNTTEC